MSTVTTWEPTTVPALAGLLGINRITLSSWAFIWHGRVGTGNPRRLDTVDRFVARAWQILAGNYGGNWGGHGYGRSATSLMLRVDTAIRSDPRAWLLIAGTDITTFDTAEDAALAWALAPAPAGLLIDLWGTQ